MRRLVAAAAILVLLLTLTYDVPAAPAAPEAVPAVTVARVGWVTTTVTMVVDGLTRGYLVARPAGSAKARALPVLVELHGCCTTPAAELVRAGFPAVTGPAILVYPAGYHRFWNAGACCGGTGVDDVTFVTAVVEQVLARQPGADPDRVYLVGYSNGGRMAYRMACEKPELFAGVAVFAAVNAMACPRAAPVPLLISAGTADPEVTASAGGIRHSVDGYLEPTVDEQAEFYRRADGCRGEPTTTVAGDLISLHWTVCASGDTVQLSWYAGAEHSWPAGLAGVMWTFLRRLHR